MASSYETELRAINERLARLERQNRTLKRIGASALAVLGAALLLGQAATPSRQSSGRTVEAERFVLLDRNGKPSAMLGLLEGGSGLILVDDKGINRCRLSLNKDGPALTLCDEASMPRVAVTMVKDKGAVSLADEKGRILVSLSLSEKGPDLIFRDDDGKAIWEAPQ